MSEPIRETACPMLRNAWRFLLGVCACVSLFPLPVSAGASNDLNLKVTELVTRLDYPEEVAAGFLHLVGRWKEPDGKESLQIWRDDLSRAKSQSKEGKTTAKDLALTEIAVAGGINAKILKEIKISDVLGEYFLLQDVVRDRQMLCLGYSQVYYVIANAVGLKARVIEVAGYAPVYASTPRLGHVACLVTLADGRSIMVDYNFTSGPFQLGDTFLKEGVFLRMKDRSNPLKMHTRIQILDELGIRAHVQLNLGKRSEKAGDLQKALQLYSRSIELNPRFASALVNRGAVHDQRGMHEKALADYNRALSLDPESATAYSCRGTLWDSQGDYDKALADYNRAVELRPKMAVMYVNRGSTYLRKGDRAKAINDLNVALELDPAYVKAYLQRGNAYFDLGQCEKAIQDYNKTLELERNHSEAYVNRGICHAKTGDKTRATQDLNRAMELNPSLRDWILRKGAEYKLNLAGH